MSGLNLLPDEINHNLPVDDLLGWIVSRYPQKDTADTLTGFTRLVFDGKLLRPVHNF